MTPELLLAWLAYKLCPKQLSAITLKRYIPIPGNLNDTIDADENKIFAAIIIQHHTSAIDMARASLEYSSDKQIVVFSKQLLSN
ncbi:MAG: DUF305 domain-containing protein [Chitinophagaceae bacterium]